MQTTTINLSFKRVLQWLGWIIIKVIASIAVLILLISLPFVVWIKTALSSFYQGWPSFVAIIMGSIVAFVILLSYLLIMDKYIYRSRTFISFKFKIYLTAILVVLFNIYALYLFSANHVKHAQLLNEYDILHPILRLSVQTMAVFDHGLVVTDVSRQRKDYKLMRLKENNRSRHYVQKDGYVYAIDIRTLHRSMLRNWLIEAAFSILGFDTLRHHGTADHLHVAMKLRD